MITFLDCFISIRFKRARRRGSLVSLISIISTLSIALGMVVLIVGLSAMNGFERELRQRILSVIPHVEFYPQTGTLSNWKDISNQLMNAKHIISVAPYISFTSLLENGNKLSAVFVKGIDIEKEPTISALPNFVTKEGWKKFAHSQDSIILGKGLAKRLNVQQGDWLTLLVPDINNHQLKSLKRIRVEVAGILSLSGNLGHKFVLISLQSAQRYMNIGDSVTGLMANVDNVFNAYHLAAAAAKQVTKTLSFSSWEYEYGYMYRDIQMVRSIMSLAMALVIGISCFSIVSTLVIAVKDKQGDIAILKTLGAPNQLIRNIFLYYGLISGIIGSAIGCTIGAVIALNLSYIVAFVESIIGHKFLDGQIYFIDFMPSELHFSDLSAVFITTMTLSLIASYYPARRACKIDPARVLNNN